MRPPRKSIQINIDQLPTMCKIRLTPDPEGPIAINSRPTGRPPPPSPRSARLPRLPHHSAYLEERSPRLSSHSTLAVDVIERGPKASRRSLASPRIVQDRSARTSGMSIQTIERYPPPPPEPPSEFDGPSVQFYAPRSPSGSPNLPPPAPQVPKHRQSSSVDTVISSRSRHHDRQREETYRRASQPPPSVSDASREERPSRVERHSSRPGQSAKDLPPAIGKEAIREQGRSTQRESNISQRPQVHQDSHRRTVSEPQVAEKREMPLSLEDASAQRPRQLAEERILYGDDGWRRKQYHYR